MIKTCHNPERLLAVLGAPGASRSSVYLDTETTGVDFNCKLVSLGVLVEDTAFILFVNSLECSTQEYRITLDQLRQALRPLTETSDRVVVMHNAVFDLRVLRQCGIDVKWPVHDTMKLLILHDPDRLRSDRASLNRYKLRGGDWRLNYRLKDVVLHELRLKSPHYPGNMATLPYAEHRKYLTCDLISTRRLYEWLLARVTREDLDYYNHLVAPITPILVGLTVRGVRADRQWIGTEMDRLRGLLSDLCRQHAVQFNGQRLDVGDFHLRGWIYLSQSGLRCRMPREHWRSARIGGCRKFLPPVTKEALKWLLKTNAGEARTRPSLELISQYLDTRTCLQSLGAVANHVDAYSGRIHAVINDRQATGRVSVTSPNLQGVPKAVDIGSKQIRPRDALTASDGMALVAFDIAQADVRVLAHVVESCKDDPNQLDSIYEDRRRQLPGIAVYLMRSSKLLRQGSGSKPSAVQLTFNPAQGSALANDFRTAGDDFYTHVAKRAFGREIDRTERQSIKQTILGIVNGMGVNALAKKLDIDEATARDYQEKVKRLYPNEFAWIEYMYHVIALRGYSETWAGRRRRCTPHYWMTNSEKIELFISYRGRDKLRLKVVPLKPTYRFLRCWVKSVIDVAYKSKNAGKEIYHDKDGRISQYPYRFFEDENLTWRLPVRNIPWRIIREVRHQGESSRYPGFDQVKRQILNHVFQGGTADVVKMMMLRSVSVCQKYRAHLLLNIHDELVFEVPEERKSDFINEMKHTLEEWPDSGWRVPIVVEPKHGKSFGSLQTF